MTERTWFITGVNSGFGRLMTEQLLARGERVAGTARRLVELDDLKGQYGERLWLAVLDLSDTAAIRPVVDRAFAELGRIDVVVNNAGYGLFGPAEEPSDAQMMEQIRVNLVGSMQVARAALPHLRAQGGGRIIQVSTMGGQAAFPGGAFYHAGKWGIEGFMEATALDVGPFGIGVTIVEPGSARTAFRYGGAKLGVHIPAYDASPAGFARRMLADATSVPIGDPARMAAAIITSADQSPAPLRLALGSDAYGAMHKALGARLASLEAQKDLAWSTDAD